MQWLWFLFFFPDFGYNLCATCLSFPVSNCSSVTSLFVCLCLSVPACLPARLLACPPARPPVGWSVGLLVGWSVRLWSICQFILKCNTSNYSNHNSTHFGYWPKFELFFLYVSLSLFFCVFPPPCPHPSFLPPHISLPPTFCLSLHSVPLSLALCNNITTTPVANLLYTNSSVSLLTAFVWNIWLIKLSVNFTSLFHCFPIAYQPIVSTLM